MLYTYSGNKLTTELSLLLVHNCLGFCAVFMSCVCKTSRAGTSNGDDDDDSLLLVMCSM